MLINIASLLFYSAATGFCVMYGVKLLDFCMDYPNPLWKIRYNIAKSFTDDIDALESFKATADIAEADDRPEIMKEAYRKIVTEKPGFKRWTCVWCMATFIGIFISLIVAAFLVPLYGWWVILYWSAVFPFIAAFGRI